MTTTLAKLQELIVELESTPPGEVIGRQRDVMELLQIARGFGLDPVSFLIPETEAEADGMVDGLIVLLFHLRGDDLPPFDLERHIRDATATDPEPDAGELPEGICSQDPGCDSCPDPAHCQRLREENGLSNAAASE